MNQKLSEEVFGQLFTQARTHHDWLSKEVTDFQIRELYDVMKWAPTALNAAPLRMLFLKSKESRERLVPALMGSNVEQVRSSPVTAIIAYDLEFFEKLPYLFPAFDAKAGFVGNPTYIESTAFRNSSLQGGYLILAARSLGLDAGPMSGFNPAEVDHIFFSGTSWKVNFICNIGYGNANKLYPRGPRLSFDEVAKIL